MKAILKNTVPLKVMDAFSQSIQDIKQCFDFINDPTNNFSNHELLTTLGGLLLRIHDMREGDPICEYWTENIETKRIDKYVLTLTNNRPYNLGVAAIGFMFPHIKPKMAYLSEARAAYDLAIIEARCEIINHCAKFQTQLPSGILKPNECVDVANVCYAVATSA